MYNHARSLLVNLNGSQSLYEGFPGEEFIPENYKQLELPTYLDSVRARLFGVKPDRAMLNYRTAQLLSLIAQTDLNSYVLALDSRLTYSNFDLFSFDFFPTVTRYEGNSNNLELIGSPISPDVSGVSRFEFNVEVSSGNLTVKRYSWPQIQNTEAIELTDSLSQAVPLPYSGYSVKVTSTDDASWKIKGYLKPTTNLSSVLENFNSIGEPTLLSLFGPAPVEPYKTFYNCWKSHKEFAYKLSGIVMAVIYRTEEIRHG